MSQWVMRMPLANFTAVPIGTMYSIAHHRRVEWEKDDQSEEDCVSALYATKLFAVFPPSMSKAYTRPWVANSQQITTDNINRTQGQHCSQSYMYQVTVWQASKRTMFSKSHLLAWLTTNGFQDLHSNFGFSLSNICAALPASTNISKNNLPFF